MRFCGPPQGPNRTDLEVYPTALHGAKDDAVDFQQQFHFLSR